MEARGL